MRRLKLGTFFRKLTYIGVVCILVYTVNSRTFEEIQYETPELYIG